MVFSSDCFFASSRASVDVCEMEENRDEMRWNVLCRVCLISSRTLAEASTFCSVGPTVCEIC